MPYHPHAQPNFRNMVIRPMWMALKTALRTIPYIGSHPILAAHGESPAYHAQERQMIDKGTAERLGENHPSVGKKYAADRETSSLVPYIERPVTVMYPYERLEDLEPWLFVPGNFNGRIGVIWETCTACKACVRACPNSCVHMTSETRVNVLDTSQEGDEWHGYGGELEVGGFAARRNDVDNSDYDLMTAHDAVSQEYDFGSVIDISGDTATVRWDGGGMEEVPSDGLVPAEVDIVSGRIDIGRCMFCGLCMEACPFESYFMTNEYDGMSGYTREDLWMDADRTRLLPSVHQERVDSELAKRAEKEKNKRAKAKAKAEA
jgi:formate hydrogenlyase subunit 6/NADH:ubiquinone oxidoreductase subunit I